MAPIPDCPHQAVHIVAALTVGGQAPDDDKLGWSPLDDTGPPRLSDLGVLDGHAASVYLEVCAACTATVISVRTWDQAHWTAEHGPAWSTPWTPLARDGTVP
jgi:hypothetical protein